MNSILNFGGDETEANANRVIDIVRAIYIKYTAYRLLHHFNWQQFPQFMKCFCNGYMSP